MDLSALAANYGKRVPPPMTPLIFERGAVLTAASLSLEWPTTSNLTEFSEPTAEASLQLPESAHRQRQYG